MKPTATKHENLKELMREAPAAGPTTDQPVLWVSNFTFKSWHYIAHRPLNRIFVSRRCDDDRTTNDANDLVTVPVKPIKTERVGQKEERSEDLELETSGRPSLIEIV
jgi:hypothetical protein